jgi:hypothetical protein
VLTSFASSNEDDDEDKDCEEYYDCSKDASDFGT